jgi:hypothetical protein
MTKAIVETQKALNALRKAATQAKSKYDDAKRTMTYFQEGLNQDPTKTHLVELIAKEQAKMDKAAAQRAVALTELMAVEAALPARKPSQFEAVLRWFSGSSLVKAKEALELVDASVEQGSWIPGASRKAWAAMKPNVAKKTIKVDSGYKASKADSAIHFAIAYGSFGGVAGLTLQDATRELNDDALEFYIDFQPLVDAMRKLDATRPVPTFTTMNASPTVSAELKRQGAVQVEVCPIRYEERSKTDEKGNVTYFMVAILEWPEGTKHNTSRYAYGTATNNQCHACGHAIKRMFNWVPLVLTTEAGEKRSLWVGRDCAKTLFGVDMAGDLELAEGQR